MNITIAQIKPKLGDIEYNLTQIKQAITKATDLIVLPECALTGYPLKDLIFHPTIKQATQNALNQLLSLQPKTAIILGYPKYTDQGIFNTAGVIYQNKIIHEYHKQALADFDCFNESRYFIAGSNNNIIFIGKFKFALAVCNDLWHADIAKNIAKTKVDAIISINASPFDKTKDIKRNALLSKISQDNQCPIIYTNLVGAQDSLIFDGCSKVTNKQGQLVLQLPAFKTAIQSIDLTSIPQEPLSIKTNSNQIIIAAIKLGLKEYLSQNNIKHVFIGISGGLDSALVAYLTSCAIGASNITGILMPSIYTSNLSNELAKKLCENLKIKLIKESISPCFDLLKTQLNADDNSLANQNIQARIRGLILMYYANQNQAVVINTGNKSELAMGYCTLYGDMIGAIAPIGDLTKTQVINLSLYINKNNTIIPTQIITREPSAELAPNQKDQDNLPPYDQLDQAIEENLLIKQQRSSFEQSIAATIKKQEHKRSQSPIAIRLSTSSFNIDRQYPISYHQEVF